MSKKVLELYPEQIRVMEGFNVRFDEGDMKSLQASIISRGMLVPVKVRKTKEKLPDGYFIYDLIDGHRRYKAVCNESAKLPEDETLLVPATEVDKDATDADLVMEMLVTGINSHPLNMLEQGRAIQRLIEGGMKKADIVKELGKSRSHIDDCLTLATKASESIIDNIEKGKISCTTALATLKAVDVEEAEEIIEEALEANDGKKVSSKHISDVVGEPIGRKAKEKAKSTMTGPAEESGKPTKVYEAEPELTATDRLYDLKEALEAQEDVTPNDEAFNVLVAIIRYLEGNLTASDMVPLFFLKASTQAVEEGIDENHMKKKKAAPAKKKAEPKEEPQDISDDLDADDDEDMFDIDDLDLF